MNPTTPDDEPTDIEQHFRDGLAEVIRRRPPLGPIDLPSVRREAHAPRRLSGRSVVWLAVAAVTVVVLGVALATNLPRDRQSVEAGPASSPSTPAPLVGTVWQLSTIGASPVDGTAVRPDAVFDDRGELTGSTGCARFRATYTLDQDRLTLTGLVAGDCPEIQAGSQPADRLVSAVREARRVLIAGDRLRLLDEAGTELLGFTAEPARRPTTVAPTNPASPATDVEIRLRNDSPVGLANVLVSLEEGDTDYGSVPPGQTTAYRAAGRVSYRYARVRVRVDGRLVSFLPIDHVGETPLPPGRYTYVLTYTSGSRDLGLVLEVDR